MGQVGDISGAPQTITLKWNTWLPPPTDPSDPGNPGTPETPETPVTPEEDDDDPEWYESKTFKVTVGVALSASTIALLLLLA